PSHPPVPSLGGGKIAPERLHHASHRAAVRVIRETGNRAAGLGRERCLLVDVRSMKPLAAVRQSDQPGRPGVQPATSDESSRGEGQARGGRMDHEFSAELWIWDARKDDSWTFLSVPPEVSEEIEEYS